MVQSVTWWRHHSEFRRINIPLSHGYNSVRLTYKLELKLRCDNDRVIALRISVALMLMISKLFKWSAAVFTSAPTTPNTAAQQIGLKNDNILLKITMLM